MLDPSQPEDRQALTSLLRQRSKDLVYYDTGSEDNHVSLITAIGTENIMMHRNKAGVHDSLENPDSVGPRTQS